MLAKPPVTCRLSVVSRRVVRRALSFLNFSQFLLNLHLHYRSSQSTLVSAYACAAAALPWLSCAAAIVWNQAAAAHLLPPFPHLLLPQLNPHLHRKTWQLRAPALYCPAPLSSLPFTLNSTSLMNPISLPSQPKKPVPHLGSGRQLALAGQPWERVRGGVGEVWREESVRDGLISSDFMRF